MARKRDRYGRFLKGGGGSKRRGRPKTKTIVKYRTRNPEVFVNPAPSRGRRAYQYGRQTIGGINIGSAFKSMFPLLLGALAAKAAAQKLGDKGKEGQNWSYKEYGFALLGGFVMAVAVSMIFKAKGTTAQKVMEGAFMIVGYKIFINEIASEHEALRAWFEGDNDAYPLEGYSQDAYPSDVMEGYKPGDMYQAKDGETYVLGDDNYWRPISESHRTPVFSGFGQAVKPVDPTMGSFGQAVRPVDPTMGSFGQSMLEDFRRAYSTVM